MSTHTTANLYDVGDYRRRKALRDCGQGSRRREFLWVHPASGAAQVAVFRPAQPTAAAVLLRSARTAGRHG
ncbi:hypothetical protein FZ025_06655 [Xanthomonas hyacinthi]|uniref:Uncharacterized protein n=2 Tax=Xanthomonas hyacinthi TaxID=56455 RepID=A0A2S7EWB6_9XANT|nr:hypothetical protein [Xanthomonas hyacinthi]KLD75182.1 hypothetical protein Y886_28465 [Xanthomonas hyacinthi DSM 19077]PPU97331.1 hypothetical protein XhyaCFBP1156_11705 [Xanthomonas hyacinthi]QGY76364.1 hypothetical protein FZ025_06655 [Xanthomonas hyacinthi]